MKSALILSAALLSTTALAGTAQAQDVQIENAVARVIVLVEDRADVAVEIERGRADLPVPTVRQRGDRIEVDGNLPRRAIRNCHVPGAIHGRVVTHCRILPSTDIVITTDRNIILIIGTRA